MFTILVYRWFHDGTALDDSAVRGAMFIDVTIAVFIVLVGTGVYLCLR